MYDIIHDIRSLQVLYKYCDCIIFTFLGSTSEPELAAQVMQFIYLSDSGFRFPISQFPSGSCTPSDLYHIWKGVLKMLEFGFT